MSRAIPLGERFDDDGASRHVDTQRERFRGVDHLDQAHRKQVLDDLLHEGQHASMVGSDASHQRALPGIDTKNHRVLGRKDSDRLLHIALDLTGLNASRQRDARGENLRDGIFATRPGEDEGDGGQQMSPIQAHEGRRPRLPARAPAAIPRTLAASRTRQRIGGGRHQLGVEPVLGSGRIQVEYVLADDHVLVERNGPLLGDDDLAAGADLADPRTKLLGVRYRGGQRNDRHVGG